MPLTSTIEQIKKDFYQFTKWSTFFSSTREKKRTDNTFRSLSFSIVCLFSTIKEVQMQVTRSCFRQRGKRNRLRGLLQNVFFFLFFLIRIISTYQMARCEWWMIRIVIYKAINHRTYLRIFSKCCDLMSGDFFPFVSVSVELERTLSTTRTFSLA